MPMQRQQQTHPAMPVPGVPPQAPANQLPPMATNTYPPGMLTPQSPPQQQLPPQPYAPQQRNHRAVIWVLSVVLAVVLLVAAGALIFWTVQNQGLDRSGHPTKLTLDPSPGLGQTALRHAPLPGVDTRLGETEVGGTTYAALEPLSGNGGAA